MRDFGTAILALFKLFAFLCTAITLLFVLAMACYALWLVFSAAIGSVH